MSNKSHCHNCTHMRKRKIDSLETHNPKRTNPIHPKKPTCTCNCHLRDTDG